MAHRIPSAFAAAALAAAALALPQTLSAREPGPLDALLVVQNHVSDDFRKPLADLGDRVSAALSGDLLHIIDPNDAIGVNQNRAPWGEGMPDTSATRLAGNLGAEALVTASVGEASVSGIGYPPVAQMVRMTLTLSAKRLPSGAALAAVTVTEQSPNLTLDVMAQNADAVYSELLGRLVSKASAQFLAKVAEVTVPDVAPEKVTVFFGCNVLGADVQIDGLSLGTCPGQFSVAPGVHNVLVSYPPYYLPFARQAGFETDGQTYAVVLQITPEGEQQRLRVIDWERKRAELDVWKRDQDLDFETRRGQAGFDLEKARRELNFEFDRKRRQLDRELAEGSELFKKQLDLADAMVERYRLSGEADDYVRTTIADGTSLYWQNSYGRIAITDGSAENIEFATPSTDSGDLAVPPGPKEISENLQKFLMKR
jgi:hypothetical protein